MQALSAFCANSLHSSWGVGNCCSDVCCLMCFFSPNSKVANLNDIFIVTFPPHFFKGGIATLHSLKTVKVVAFVIGKDS